MTASLALMHRVYLLTVNTHVTLLTTSGYISSLIWVEIVLEYRTHIRNTLTLEIWYILGVNITQRDGRGPNQL